MTPRHERIRRARELRRNATPAEVILWRELRDRRFAGFKFRRQWPVGPYVVDFYCRAGRLIVELDGESHVGKEAADQFRQAALEGCGYKVLRFWNPDVYDDLDCVLEAIYQECTRRAKPPPGGRAE
jgi:very-short-patch-repair endonuclease